MDTATNHLIRIVSTDGTSGDDGTYGGELPEDYESIPDELERAAKQVLRGRSEAIVSKHSGGELSKWAASRRKAKRRMASASRKRNRKK